eukprot:3754906-Rhodomonas_salina.2
MLGMMSLSELDARCDRLVPVQRRRKGTRDCHVCVGRWAKCGFMGVSKGWSEIVSLVAGVEVRGSESRVGSLGGPRIM